MIMLASEFLILSYKWRREDDKSGHSVSFWGHSLLRQGLHCFSLKMSPKVWVNSDEHCTCRAASQTTSLFSRFQSEHSCGAKSWLCTYPSGPALTGQAECLLSRALGRSQLAEVINTTHTGSSRRQAAIYSLPDQTRGGPLRIENQPRAGLYIKIWIGNWKSDK